MKTPRLCEICGSSDKHLLFERRFLSMKEAIVDGYDVVACERCGFCFADNLPTQQEFDAYYAAQSKYEDESRPVTLSDWDLRSRPFSVGIISSWLPDKSARILDIGCAAGALLGELKRQGYANVKGLDPSPTCCRAAKKLFDIDVAPGTISHVPTDLGTFDLVIFGSVLEHILDLKGAVRAVRKLLNPGGCAYIEIPDMSRCALMNDAPFQEFSVEHINFFSPISVENLWRAQGFETVGIRQTEIDQIPGLTLYEVKAMFRMTGAPAIAGGAADFKMDTQARPEIERYVQKSQQKLERIERVIDALADSRKPIIVWGVGTHTQGLLAKSRLKDVNIKAFVDSNTRYTGQQLNGIPILPVADLARHGEPILISSQQFQNEIVAKIRSDLKLPNELITLYA